MCRGKPTQQYEGLMIEGTYLEGEVEPGLIKERIAMQHIELASPKNIPFYTCGQARKEIAVFDSKFCAYKTLFGGQKEHLNKFQFYDSVVMFITTCHAG